MINYTKFFLSVLNISLVSLLNAHAKPFESDGDYSIRTKTFLIS